HPERYNERLLDHGVGRDRLVGERILAVLVLQQAAAGQHVEIGEEVVEVKIVSARQQSEREVERLGDRYDRQHAAGHVLRDPAGQNDWGELERQPIGGKPRREPAHCATWLTIGMALPPVLLMISTT